MDQLAWRVVLDQEELLTKVVGGMGKSSEMEHSVIMHAQARVSRNGSNVLADHHEE